jgi:uncharacterized protein (TIGR00369 family)
MIYVTTSSTVFTAMSPTHEQLDLYAREFSNSQMLKHFGAVVSFPNGNTVEVRIATIRPEFRGGMGTTAVNGGILSAMFDLAIGCTAALVDPTRRSATIQLSMNFMRPVLGETLRAIAKIESHGSSSIFASAKIVDERDEVCATAQGISKIAKVSWAGGKSSPGLI